MALKMEQFLKRAFTHVDEGEHVDVEQHLLYTVDKLHRANIRDMFGRWWGTPTSLDSLDPDMSLPSKRLLDMACAGKRILIPGIIERMRPCRLSV